MPPEKGKFSNGTPIKKLPTNPLDYDILNIVVNQPTILLIGELLGDNPVDKKSMQPLFAA